MNILLIGMPGSGKSTIANLLSEYLPTFQKIEIDEAPGRPNLCMHFERLANPSGEVC